MEDANNSQNNFSFIVNLNTRLSNIYYRYYNNTNFTSEAFRNS